MKKFFNLFLTFVMVVAVMFSGTVLISANAQAEEETYEVILDFILRSEAEFARNKHINVTFENKYTKEVHEFTVQAGNRADYVYLPEGEYSLVNVNLSEKPEFVFETSSSDFSVDGESNFNICSAAIVKVMVTDKVTSEEIEEYIQKQEKEVKDYFSLLVGIILWSCLGLISLTYKLRAKFTKKYFKIPLLEAKAAITGHVFFGVLCGFLTGILAGGDDMFWLFAIIGFGFPFGILAALMIFSRKKDEDDDIDKYNRERDRNSSAGGVLLVFVMVIGLVIGAIATPFVIIYDIVRLFKAYSFKHRERKKLKYGVSDYIQ